MAGAAQRRTRWGLLHQGSIQIPLDAGAVRGESGLLLLQGTTKLAEAFADGVRQIEIAPALLQAAEHIAREKYATDAWLRKF